MAVTKIIPIRCTIDKSIDYICNARKTEKCKYIHSEHCFPQTAAMEFEIYLRQAQAGNTIGRHLIQSFAPDETTPEQAHEIGRKLAAEILGGQYAYVMSTHVDRDHIHNHFVWCAVNLQTSKKYRSNKQTYHHIQDTSDRLCAEYSLSVITEKSGRRGKSYYEYQAEKQGTGWKAKLREMIDDQIASCSSYAEFLHQMDANGYEIKQGKYISFRAPGQERFIRAKTLGDDYTEERIRERLQRANQHVIMPGKYNEPPMKKVIDIEGNAKIQGSPSYEHWARIHNIKTMAENLIYLQENDMADVDEINRRYKASVDNFWAAKNILTATEERIKVLEALQTQLRYYGRTKDRYKLFNEAKDKDKFLRKNEGAESDIMLHEAAKRYFKSYTDKHGKPLPKSRDVADELATLRAAKSQQYADYRAAKAEYDTMTKIKVNTQYMLGEKTIKDYAPDFSR